MFTNRKCILFQVAPISSLSSFPILPPHVQRPPSPTGISLGTKSGYPPEPPLSPLIAVVGSTPSPTVSINSQLSPCSMKENYDPTEQTDPISTQQSSLNITQTKAIVNTKNKPLQFSAVPVQFHQENVTKLRSQATLAIKRKKRNTRKGNKIAKCNLSVIARHKKLGDGALNKLKNEVQAYAVDHTYKETARKFGIHHSTVSGWIKRSSAQQQQINSCRVNSVACQKADTFQQNSCISRSHVQMAVNDGKEAHISSNCNYIGLNKGEQTCTHNSYANKVNY